MDVYCTLIKHHLGGSEAKRKQGDCPGPIEALWDEENCDKEEGQQA